VRSVEQQLQAAIALASPLDPLDLSLRESRGCVAAADITAAYPIPSFDSASRDGYAVAAESVSGATAANPVSLKIVDVVNEGYSSDTPVASGQAVAISAGALMPEGADAVLAETSVQDADDSDEIAVTDSFVGGSGVTKAGSQRHAGAVVVPAGTRLGDRELAAVATAGHARVAVHPQPRVVVVTVGDELVDTTRALTAGLVHDSVSVMLTASGDQAGATTFRGGPSRRDEATLARTIEDQLVRADLIVVVGEDDGESEPGDGLVASALKAAGCEDLEYCQLEPGPAIGLGTVGEDQIPVVTVGRTPLSAFVGFEVAVRPIIAALAGRESLFRPVVRANLTDALASKSDRRQFIPAIVRLDSAAPRAIVTVLDEPADEAALWLFRANALVIAPESATSLAAQEEVAVIRLDRE